jgi:hypothetical protein
MKEWVRCEYLEDIFGKECLSSMPCIQIINGCTDYLDQVKAEDFVNSQGDPTSLVKGIDVFGRPFVSMKVAIWNVGSPSVDQWVYTIFKRYTNENTWVMCISHNCSGKGGNIFAELVGASTRINDSAKENLTKFATSINTDGAKCKFQYNKTTAYECGLWI